MKKNVKTLTEHNTLTQLPLLIHTKEAPFQWSQVLIEQFYLYARKNGLRMNAMYHWKDVLQCAECPVLIIIGTDALWLKEVLEHLKLLSIRFILLNGVINHNYNCHISRIMYDQKSCVEDSLALLSGLGRTKPAFFGVQPNDSSDESKASCFACQFSPEDVYRITDSLDACFHSFLEKTDRYDSVICSNDILAVYLMTRCSEHGIRIPEDLYLVGNGKLQIGSHVTPALTTAYYDVEVLVDVVVQTCRTLCSISNINSIDIYLKAAIHQRASTGCHTEDTDDKKRFRDLYFTENTAPPLLENLFPEIEEIRNLDHALTLCTPMELHILQLLTADQSYEVISQQMILSPDTVKYHIKKLYKRFGIHTRCELKELADKYHIHFTN